MLALIVIVSVDSSPIIISPPIVILPAALIFPVTCRSPSISVSAFSLTLPVPLGLISRLLLDTSVEITLPCICISSSTFLELMTVASLLGVVNVI